MTRIFLACEAQMAGHPYARRDYERLLAFAQQDIVRKHVLTNDPEDAELIVFVGSSAPNFFDVRSSTLYRKYRKKSVLFCSGDRAVPILPGVYTCLEKRWYAPIRKGARAGFYLRVAENSSMDMPERINEARYLFSFVGSSLNHPVRKAVCRLSSPGGLIRDTACEGRQADGASGENQERGMRYRDIIAQSKFILCPAGKGVSSWRLFETMRAGRVPVVIADRWIPPDGPLWDSFAVFVPEREVASIPERLEQLEPKAPAMGALARTAWETFYSEQTAFSTVIDQLLEAHAEFQRAGRFAKYSCFLQYLEPFYFRHWLLSPLKNRLRAT